tara:strand:- start:99 stop:485 length:387 start_codon:yes stop_codon:yes gene_type:complete
MRIIGIGIDIVKNNRIKEAIKNKRFLNRIYGKNELLNFKKISNKTSYFSKRFAAKEALAKAMGSGFRNKLNFKDIQVTNDKMGRPYYMVSPKIVNLIKNQKKVKNFNLFLSISDEKEYSIAFTIIQKN